MAAESLLTDPLLSFASIAEAYDQLGHTLGWRFLTCPSRNLASPKLALITINPGGSDYEAPIWSVESGSAYVVESWKGSPPGQARLQLQVRQMFQVLDFDPAEALSGYLVPFRSKDWTSLRNKDASLQFGLRLWVKILSSASPQLIVAFGKDVGTRLAQSLSVVQTQSLPAKWGKQTIDVHRLASRQKFIVLPHLSRFALFSRAASRDAFLAALRMG